MSDYVYLAVGMFIFVPLLAIWLWSAFDAATRPDLKAGTKVLWIVAIFLLPLIGTVAYLIFRARKKPEVSLAEWDGNYDPLPRSATDSPRDRLTY